MKKKPKKTNWIYLAHFLRIIETRAIHIIAMATPISISSSDLGPTPKIIGMGPIKITTLLLAEPPLRTTAKATTIMPTRTRAKPMAETKNNHLERG